MKKFILFTICIISCVLFIGCDVLTTAKQDTVTDDTLYVADTTIGGEVLSTTKKISTTAKTDKVYIDDEPPTMNCSDWVINIGDNIDLGDMCNVSDNSDGDIYLNAFGTINVNQLGRYFLTIVARDENGNESSDLITVEVTDSLSINNIDYYLDYNIWIGLDSWGSYNVFVKFFGDDRYNYESVYISFQVEYRGDFNGLIGQKNTMSVYFNYIDSYISREEKLSYPLSPTIKNVVFISARVTGVTGTVSLK